jgi:uncharacterized damage-inducible protein DinB
MTERDEGAVPDRWTAATVYEDMWVDPDDDPRDTGESLLDERGTLLAYLRAYRHTLVMKCADLDAEQLARRSALPSTMSLLGLVRHMADVERSWFRNVMAQEGVASRYSSDADPYGAWIGAVGDPAGVAEAWAAWHEEVAFAERFVDTTTDLGAEGHGQDGSPIQLRELLVHMIEEYARHCGHADLLRERIDGRVGQ